MIDAGAASIEARLRSLADPAIAAHSQRFFKTGAGQYGEGDVFLGIRVPVLRRLAGELADVPLASVLAALRSPLHEQRLLALLLLVRRFERGAAAERKRIFTQYLRHVRRYVNNWDLVDGSAPQIVGGYLLEAGTDDWAARLEALARSANLWERRVAIMATFPFTRAGRFEPTLHIAALLLDDREDLIHKAAGWMLREVGNRDRAAAEQFLQRHCGRMPRTMLRYAIEKFPPRLRQAYLSGSMHLGQSSRERRAPRARAVSRG